MKSEYLTDVLRFGIDNVLIVKIKKNCDIKVVMRKFLQPEEEDLEVDGIGLEHKKLLLCIMYDFYGFMDRITKYIESLMNELGNYPDTINIEITNKKDCTILKITTQKK